MLLTVYRVISDPIEVDKWAIAIFFSLIVIGFMATLFLQLIKYGLLILEEKEEGEEDVPVLQKVRSSTQDGRVEEKRIRANLSE